MLVDQAEQHASWMMKLIAVLVRIFKMQEAQQTRDYTNPVVNKLSTLDHSGCPLEDSERKYYYALRQSTQSLSQSSN